MCWNGWTSKTVEKQGTEPSLPIHDVRMLMEDFTHVPNHPHFNRCTIGAKKTLQPYSRFPFGGPCLTILEWEGRVNVPCPSR
ncbi:hypothetical protein BT93_F2171 [Corymbia citriodora subsp. variegata]|nr:hypothetical protein BT93_F2171 [Corymbia citriodora subsp. variegata]